MKMIYLSPGSIQEADPSAESSYGKTITLSFHNIIINNFIIMATLKKKKRITPLYAPVNKKKKRGQEEEGRRGEKGQIVDRQLSEGGSRIAARSKSIEIP